MDDDVAALIRQAELIIYQSGWHILEETALASLAGTRGLRYAPLVPQSQVIQIVTYDGRHLGHIRRDTLGASETWTAVRRGGRTAGRYPAAQDAAEALAIASGRPTRRSS